MNAIHYVLGRVRACVSLQHSTGLNPAVWSWSWAPTTYMDFYTKFPLDFIKSQQPVFYHLASFPNISCLLLCGLYEELTPDSAVEGSSCAVTWTGSKRYHYHDLANWECRNDKTCEKKSDNHCNAYFDWRYLTWSFYIYHVHLIREPELIEIRLGSLENLI